MAVVACPSIPSSEAAFRLVRDSDPGALPAVVGTLLGRAVLIAIGLWLVRSDDEPGHLVRDSLGAAAALEVFLLAYAAVKTRKGPQP